MEAELPAGMVKHMLVAVLAADVIQKLNYDDYKFAVLEDGVSVVLPTASGRWAAVCSVPCDNPTNDELESTIAAWNNLPQDERHELFLKYWPHEANVAVVSACVQIRHTMGRPTSREVN
jgi:hypothetical protein